MKANLQADIEEGKTVQPVYDANGNPVNGNFDQDEVFIPDSELGPNGWPVPIFTPGS